MFRRDTAVWTRAERQSHSRRAKYTISRTQAFYTDPLPTDLQRATVSVVPGLWHSTVEITGIGDEAVVVSPDPRSLLDAWMSDRATLEWTPEDVQVVGSEAELVKALRDGKLRVISDGSYKDHLGTAVVQLTTKNRKNIIWIRCQTPDSAKSQSAYRSELAGLLCGILAVSWLATVHKVTGEVTVACDGLSALEKSFSNWHLHPQQAQFDLLSAIRGVRANMTVTWVTRHVKGHADEHKSWSRLDWWEQRNVEVDRAAQQYRKVLSRRTNLSYPNPWFPTERWALFINGEKQSRLDPLVLQSVITAPALKEYWIKKGRFPADAYSLIDWTSVERAMSDSPPALRRWVTKHTVGMCSVGKFRTLWR